MPNWEHYEIETETSVTVKADGKIISQFKTFGESKAGSNDDVDKADIVVGVVKAIKAASLSAARMAGAVRENRRRELGYRDGH